MGERRFSRTVKQAAPITVFIDSSVLFTAIKSPSGGSAKLFTLKKIKLISSPLVLGEVERNVRKKLQTYHLERFFLLVSKVNIINQKPSLSLLNKAKKVITEKDAVILAEAKRARTHLLVTLDKRHFFSTSVSTFLEPQKVVTPKMIIRLMTT